MRIQSIIILPYLKYRIKKKNVIPNFRFKLGGSKIYKLTEEIIYVDK